MNLALISCYEPGHQSVAVASAAAFLRRAGFEVSCFDLAVEPLDEAARARLASAPLVAISAPMHTAMALGLRLGARVRRENPAAHLCFFGMYAELNRALLEAGPADTVLGPDCEEALVAVARRVRDGVQDGRKAPAAASQAAGAPRTHRLALLPPDRDGLPALERYAQLELGGGERRVAGHVEATRGCKHRCRHCPLSPVYDGHFTAVPAEIVLGDARRQIAAGARHIDFGDPDFLNGPRHALEIVRALHAEHPDVTFSFTAKVEHILRERAVFPELRALGCLFVITAVESLSDEVLRILDKGHTRADVAEALAVARAARISLRPTFVPFTPWSSLADVLDLCRFVREHRLEREVDPVQLSIRLLVPPGSLLLALAEMQAHLTGLDAEGLTHGWRHPDPRVDELQARIAALVEDAARAEEEPARTFARVHALVAEAAGVAEPPPRARIALGPPPPRLTEKWFCCAQPTQAQLDGI